MATEAFYSGGYSSLNPKFGEKDFFTDYRMPASTISVTSDGRTANQVKAVSNALNTGIKNVEISMLTPDVFESIPEQHLVELNRQLKLTGAKASAHGILVDPSGYSNQGMSESNRENAERQMMLAVERIQKVDPTGNIPITFHSSNMPGTEYKVEKKDGKKVLVASQIAAIDKESGKLGAFKGEFVNYPERGKVYRSPEERLETHNYSQWQSQIMQLNHYKKEADELLEEGIGVLGPKYDEILEARKKGFQIPDENLTQPMQTALRKIDRADMMLDNLKSQLTNMYDSLLKYGDLPAERKKNMSEDNKMKIKGAIQQEMAKVADNWKTFGKNGNAADPFAQGELIDSTLKKLKALPFVPETLVPLEEYAKDKASETFANVALHAYDKFKDKAPIISIENPPAGMGISTGTALKELVVESRKKFADKLIDEQGLSKSEAEDVAKKLIGATWDVGHINMLRKVGFEAKDIVKQTEEIAPFVKHVHLSDNFGFEHTELPMGMGNVPIKEMMEKLGKEGFQGKRVVEAISWWQHFSEQGKIPALTPTLEAFGSPIYAMQMGPYWNQSSGLLGGYFAGYGAVLPEQHFQAYGAGFESLPLELGGQVQGKRDRFSGSPMD